MNIATTLKMDMAQPSRNQQVFCVQGDSFSRTVVLELLSGGTAWLLPEGTSVLISYYKPDGTCGTYTHLPDGTQAWQIRENTITLVLTPQMLTAAGLVAAQLKLVCGEETISTFAFQIMVRPGLAPGDDPQTYSAWLTAYLPQPQDADPGQYLQVSQIDDAGRVTGITATEITLPPDHTDRIRELEGRTFDLENSIGSIPQLGNRVTALERSTGEIQSIKNRVTDLEQREDEIPQLKERMTQLERSIGSAPDLEAKIEELETGLESLTQMNGRITELEEGMGDIEKLENRLETVELTADTIVRLDARVNALESNGSQSYPAEWRGALEVCVETIRQHQDYGGTAAVSFAYFGDSHDHNGCAGALIAHVLEECAMPFSFYCGDMVSQADHDDIQSVDQQISSFNAMMSPVPSHKDLRALGEYDFCRRDTAGRVWNMELNQIYNRFFRKQYCRNQCVPGWDATHFYIDDRFHKIRFVVLNSVYFSPEYNEDFSIRNWGDYGFGQEQIDWLIHEALHFEEEDWSVVFFSHSPISNQGDSNLRDAHLVLGILSAFMEKTTYSARFDGRDSVEVEADFQDAPYADIIGWFSGHTHQDSITTLELSVDYDYPLNVVTIASDNESEHAIDFVTVDKDLRTVFLTRLGNGENRSFTY